MIVFGFVCLVGLQALLVWRVGKLERGLAEERDRMLERVNEDWTDTLLLIRRCDSLDRRLIDLRDSLESRAH